MIKTFTKNDLIRYIYQETSQEENTEIECALIFDEVLSDELSELKQSAKALNTIERTPSKSCIDRILNYSKTYDSRAVN